MTSPGNRVAAAYGVGDELLRSIVPINEGPATGGEAATGDRDEDATGTGSNSWVRNLISANRKT